MSSHFKQPNWPNQNNHQHPTTLPPFQQVNSYHPPPPPPLSHYHQHHPHQPRNHNRPRGRGGSSNYRGGLFTFENVLVINVSCLFTFENVLVCFFRQVM